MTPMRTTVQGLRPLGSNNVTKASFPQSCSQPLLVKAIYQQGISPEFEGL